MNVWEALIARLWKVVVSKTENLERGPDDGIIVDRINDVIERALDEPEMTFLKLAELVYTMDMEYYPVGNHEGLYLPMSPNEFLATIVHGELYTVLANRFQSGHTFED